MCLSSEECLLAVTTMIDVAPQQKLKQENRLTHNSPKEKLIIFRQLFCGRNTNITHWTERILLASPKTQRDLTETNVNDQQKIWQTEGRTMDSGNNDLKPNQQEHQLISCPTVSRPSNRDR